MANIIGRSPIAVPVLIIGKLAFLGSFLFFIVKLSFPDLMLFDSIPTRIAGLLLLFGGFVMVIAGYFDLGQSVSVGLPDEQTELKVHGLYRYSRNPMYLGGFMMCVGSCLYAIHWVNFLLAAVAVATHIAIVKREEKFLEDRFGESYVKYRRVVPRFFGLPGSSR